MQKLLSFATDFYFASKNPLYPYLSNEFNQPITSSSLSKRTVVISHEEFEY
jgi:hypothetical protein